jgi:hypothetical protein
MARLELRIPDGLKERLEAAARARGLTVSELLRKLAQAWLDKQEKQDG